MRAPQVSVAVLIGNLYLCVPVPELSVCACACVSLCVCASGHGGGAHRQLACACVSVCVCVHQVTVAVLIDNFISATVEMEADKAAAEAAVLKRKEQVSARPAPPERPPVCDESRAMATCRAALGRSQLSVCIGRDRSPAARRRFDIK